MTTIAIKRVRHALEDGMQLVGFVLMDVVILALVMYAAYGLFNWWVVHSIDDNRPAPAQNTYTTPADIHVTHRIEVWDGEPDNLQATSVISHQRELSGGLIVESY